jgi:hypothetical protein
MLTPHYHPVLAPGGLYSALLPQLASSGWGFASWLGFGLGEADRIAEVLAQRGTYRAFGSF